MINTSPIATETQEDVTPVSNYVFFKLFETSGTALADSAGNSADMTLSGTLTNAYDNLGYITFDATTMYANVVDDYIKALMRFDTLEVGNQIIVSFDMYNDGGVTTNNGVMWFGANGNTDDGWAITFDSAQRIIIAMSSTDSATEDNVFTGWNFTAGGTPAENQRNTVTVDIRVVSATTFDAHLYSNGGDNSVSSLSGILIEGNGTGFPQDTKNRGLTLGARNNSGVGSDRFIEGRMSQFFAMRRDTTDTTLAQAINKELHEKVGDLPTCLDGK